MGRRRAHRERIADPDGNRQQRRHARRQGIERPPAAVEPTPRPGRLYRLDVRFDLNLLRGMRFW